MALDIPKEEVATIAAIKALPAVSVEKLISALTTAPLISNPKEMAAYVVKQVSSIPAKELHPLLSTIYTFYYIRGLAGVSNDRFLQDLMDGIKDNSELTFTKKEYSSLQSRIKKLLNIDTLNAISKAARLQRDGERLYCEAKILSDIRPVFGNDPSVRPVGAVLTHTLKIGYHLARDHQEFHVVLESDDLEALSEVISRAKLKDQSLRDLLNNAKIPNLGE